MIAIAGKCAELEDGFGAVEPQHHDPQRYAIIPGPWHDSCRAPSAGSSWLDSGILYRTYGEVDQSGEGAGEQSVAGGPRVHPVGRPARPRPGGRGPRSVPARRRHRAAGNRPFAGRVGVGAQHRRRHGGRRRAGPRGPRARGPQQRLGRAPAGCRLGQSRSGPRSGRGRSSCRAVPGRVSASAARPVLVFDASPLLAWVLQANDQWRRVQRLFESPAECVMPASALVETIYVARERGNTATPAQLHAALVAQGLRIEPITEDDTEWAGAVITESRANPARWTTTRGEREGTLSLGDGL